MTESFAADIDAVQRIAAVPKILEIACRTTGMRFAAVARVTEDRWIACEVRDEITFGLKPGGELEIKTTICDEIRASGELVVIDHVAEDPRYAKHHTPQTYGLQSYISVPIVRADGSFFGTLCAIDPEPHRVNTPEIVGSFQLFAELIAHHLDAQDKLEAGAEALKDERRISELREQFIAVLGHDLRNPLASIDAGAKLIQRTPLNEKAASILGMVESSVRRMAGLIDNLLDFANVRLGSGLSLNREAKPLQPTLMLVIDELRAAHPTRTIEARLSYDAPVVLDHGRIAQLVSNLLANALTHGAEDTPVEVTASEQDGALVISVSNQGDAIPLATMERLFMPFERGAVRPGREGLGLGLYIATEIARAHGGKLSVASDPVRTSFSFEMPL